MKVSLISWWEDELTCDDRTNLMKSIQYGGWQGTTEERHKKLKEMYDNRSCLQKTTSEVKDEE